MAYNENIGGYYNYSDYNDYNNVCSNVGCQTHSNYIHYNYNNSYTHTQTCDEHYSDSCTHYGCDYDGCPDHNDTCSQSYTNGCNHHYNCNDYCNNYCNNSGYYNYHNTHDRCSNHTDYNELIDKTATEKGLPKNLNWGNAWSSPPPNATINTNYVTESMASIRELKNNIQNNSSGLAAKLHRNANATISSVPDSEFDDGNSATTETPKAVGQFNKMLSNLNSIWAVTRGDDDSSNPGIPTNNRGDDIIKTELEDMANKVGELATYHDPSYLNHINYTDHANVIGSHVNTVYDNAYTNASHQNSSHTNYKDSYGDHFNHQNYANTCSKQA